MCSWCSFYVFFHICLEFCLRCCSFSSQSEQLSCDLMVYILIVQTQRVPFVHVHIQIASLTILSVCLFCTGAKCTHLFSSIITMSTIFFFLFQICFYIFLMFSFSVNVYVLCGLKITCRESVAL